MSRVHSEYDPFPARPPGAHFPFVVLAVILAAGVGVLWWINSNRFSPLHDADATPRTVTPRGDLADNEQTIIQLFRNAAPSVVFVTNLTVRRDRYSLNVTETTRGTGSGFIWDESGYVVTNLHVIQGGDAWNVTLADHSTFEARFVGGDPDKDLAVLKIEPGSRTLPPLHLGTSSDLEVGQTVLAIGNPFGFDQTLTTGVISGLNREIKADNGRPIMGVIQTDAAINPGNSGGPLLDSAGRLIGVNTAIYSPSGAYAGIGFAIPVDTVNKIVPGIIRSGNIDRPRPRARAALGVLLAESAVTRRFGYEGVMIRKVFAGSGAARAGLRGIATDRRRRTIPGDLILAIGDEPVNNDDDLRAVLYEKNVGETVTLTVRRGSRRFKVDVTLQPR